MDDQKKSTRKYFMSDIPDSEHMSEKTDEDGYQIALKFRDNNSLNGPLRVKEFDPIDERRKIDLQIAQFQKETEEYELRRQQQKHEDTIETIQAVGDLGESLAKLIPDLVRFGFWCRFTAYPTLKDRTIPWAKRGVSKLIKRAQKSSAKEKKTEQEETTFSILEEYTAEEFLALAEKAHYQYKLNVSDEDAQRHFLNMVFGATIVANEIRFFSEHTVAPANIKIGEEQQRAWHIALEELATDKVTESINTILKSNSSLLEEPHFYQLYQLIGGEETEDKVFVPIQRQDLQAVLKINRENE